MKMKRFKLNRIKDSTGVSGTGIIAAGAEFPSGRCVLEWQTNSSSIAIYKDKDEMMSVHGHGGDTRLEWLDEGDPDLLKPSKPSVAIIVIDGLQEDGKKK